MKQVLKEANYMNDPRLRRCEFTGNKIKLRGTLLALFQTSPGESWRSGIFRVLAVRLKTVLSIRNTLSFFSFLCLLTSLHTCGVSFFFVVNKHYMSDKKREYLFYSFKFIIYNDGYAYNMLHQAAIFPRIWENPPIRIRFVLGY